MIDEGKVGSRAELARRLAGTLIAIEGEGARGKQPRNIRNLRGLGK
jgi:hypothetical protein